MDEHTQPSAEDLLLGPAGPSANSVDWFALVNALLRGKVVILGTALLCAAAAALLVFNIPDSYMASVTLLPPQVNRTPSSAALLSSGGFGAEASGLAGLGSSFQTKSQADIFVMILSAWPIQDELARRFDHADPDRGTDMEKARLLVERQTTIKAAKEGIIRISVSDTDPKHAAALANGYVDAVRNLLRGMALSEASQRRVFYEGQLESSKRDLASAEVAFKAMQQKSGMIALDTQAQTLVQTAAGLRSQITAKEVELQSQRGYLTASNPQLQITQTELSALQGQLAQLESRGQGGLTGKSLSSVPASELDFVRATRELKYQEGLYDLMVKQYEGARVDEARDAPIVQVVEPALVPDQKYGPRRARDIALAFIFGLVLGVFVNLLRYAYGKIRTNSRFLELRRSALRWS